MPRVYKRRPGARPYAPYTPAQLEECLQALRDGKMTQRKAAVAYKIPRRTLSYKLKCSRDKHKAAHAAATTSSETSEPNFEPEIVIKEEPIDIDEEQLPSTSRTGDEFILPWTPADTPSTSQQTPTLGVAFTVIKKEVTDDQEDAAKKTSNGKPNKASKKKADKGEVEQSEKKLRESEEDSAKDRPKDHFDAYGEYIAAKLRKLDWKSCAYVQKAIGDIIFEAEMGKYKQ